jgi:hypothetical protein
MIADTSIVPEPAAGNPRHLATRYPGAGDPLIAELLRHPVEELHRRLLEAYALTGRSPSLAPRRVTAIDRQALAIDLACALREAARSEAEQRLILRRIARAVTRTRSDL